LKELVERGPIDANDIDNFLYERVVGETRDFLMASFLERGIRAKRSVARVVTELGGGRFCYGTGFLVSPSLLLTNHHVLPDAARAGDSSAEFDYQLDIDDNPLKVQRFTLDPDTFFLNDEALDYALVAVKNAPAPSQSLSTFGWSPLFGAIGKVNRGDAVNIVQHPRGEMKQIIIRKSCLVDLFDDRFHYDGDTEPGASGSPVFNDQWEVVALHHMSVPQTDANGEFVAVEGGLWEKGDDPARLAWAANEGIRVSSLVNHIRGAAIRDHEKPLREEFLNPTRSDNGSGPSSKPSIVVEKEPPPSSVSGEKSMRDDSSAIEATVHNGSVTFTVPVTITISIGVPVARAVPSVQPSTPAEAVLESITPDRNDLALIEWTGKESPIFTNRRRE
jgi:endonuclease G